MLNVRSALEARFPDFFERHTRIGPVLLRFLGFLFHESRLQHFEQEHPHSRGLDFVESVLRFFDFSLRTRDDERDRIPSEGRVVVVANHPIGSLDGLALLKLIADVRPDVKVVANDLLLAIEPLQPLLLPVNNMDGNTPKANLKNIKAHLETDGAVIIFPAGEVSRFSPQGVRDGEWQSGFLKIARSTKSPILPIFVAGRNSVFFYSLSFLAKPLATLWLVREMFKQCHRTVDARVGQLIPVEHYNRTEPKKVTAQRFKRHVYRLAKGKKPLFQGEQTIGAAENRVLLAREIERCELMGTTPRGREIRLYRATPGDCLIRELGRLRELSFRALGEGTGLPRDIDSYDYHYEHLLLWDPLERQVAGGYRVADLSKALPTQGFQGLYANTLFNLSGVRHRELKRSLELGRSFIQYTYRDRYSLDELWSGIGALLIRRPHIKFLYGPVSVSKDLGADCLQALVLFYSHYFPPLWPNAEPLNPYHGHLASGSSSHPVLENSDYKKDFKVLKRFLKDRSCALPPLYKYYTEVAEVGGVGFSGFNVDPKFKDCIDGLVVVDLTYLKDSRRKRYMKKDTSRES